MDVLAKTKTDGCENSLFLKAIAEARQEHESRRRRMPSFLDEDFSTIAMVVLKGSFWPFPRYPVCTPVLRAADFPCAVTFQDQNTLPCPREGATHWDLLHQLTHWCLPLEGHNEHFRSLFAAFVQQAFGSAVARRMCRRYEDEGFAYHADWLGPVEVRSELLHPFIKEEAATKLPAESGDESRGQATRCGSS